ncbi:MAG: histidinol-phosphate transaminase [Clostridium sp.]
MSFKVRKEILGLEAYIAGKPISEVKRELGIDRVVKLASNENPLGCSPKVKEAMRELISSINIYPDASSYDFKSALSKKHNITNDMIFCGAGSDSLINVICATILEPGDETIMADLTFPRYESNTLLMGATPVKIKMKDNKLDIKAMVDAITEKTKIIWFCNPNNPTGSIFTEQELYEVLDKIPSHVYMVMDEAYCEFVTSKDYPDSFKLLEKYPNTIILRTCSKAYGLASLRFGYGIARPELVDYLVRVINSFDANLFAQTAATIAIQDEEFLSEVVEFNTQEREWFQNLFKENNLEYVESQANFIMVNVKGYDKELFPYLMKKGFIIRPGFLLGVPGWIRFSFGTKEENREFGALLIDYLKDK